MIAAAKSWFVEKYHMLCEHPKLKHVVQFVKFGIVGASNTLISLAVYWLCLYVFYIHYQAANLIAFLISVTNAYYWNSKYVFKSKERRDLVGHVKAYIKALSSYGFTFLLSIGLLYVWVEMLHIPEGIAPVVNLLLTIPLNYILNKLWAFKH